MFVDYHTHHDRCGHAQGSMEDMIKAAIELGMSQIGLSDHSPFFCDENDHPSPGMTMAKSDFPNYVQEMIGLREKYKDRIDVRLGVESDYLPGLMEQYAAIYAQYPLDYIIGSVHYFRGYHVFASERWRQEDVDIDGTYVDYIRLIQEAARCGKFDILGHIDAVKGLNVPCSISLDALWDETAQVIADAGVAVEINTSGLRKKCGSWFPSADIVERLHRLGVPFAFGSDAHGPDQLLHDWSGVTGFLKEIGVKEIATFKRRERIMLSL
ncbi:histidinol-phosphatase [Paenibacillus pasadenensis]|uniref:histidinol-phosphatase n=1 Tax=Paenibacillus pasadenensis TaxID=217090 RepID=UPI002040FE87|nr:histidinol-phosphatase [Paenibacillus pasadenensis]MCM3747866.1 histidinol-phosphatase [Paenibacillus pasadenensis]